MNPSLLVLEKEEKEETVRDASQTFSEERDPSRSLAQLTCLTCRMKFVTPKEQRSHYKDDLHTFNLKRKVANLPPVSLQVFQEKASAFVAEIDLQESQQQDEKLSCSTCSKTYNSSNQYQQHIKTKKHLDNESKKEQGLLKPKEKGEPKAKKEPLSPEKVEEMLNSWKGDAEITKEEEEYIREKIANAPSFSELNCLFCNQLETTLESNISHMAKQHGFFIPDIEFLTDAKGLIHYLGQKIFIGNECLFCNGKGRGFQTAEAVQGHMKDLNHCKLVYDEEEQAELDDFYDFSTDENALALVEKGPARVADNGCELIFPDGKTVGHRLLKDYYRQNLRTPEVRESVLINALMSEYRALGWTNDLSTTRFYKNEKRDHKAERRHGIFHLKVGMKNNNQKHHRDQIL